MKCPHIKFDGNLCERKVYKKSQYCWRHNLIKRIPWASLIQIVMTLAIVISVCIATLNIISQRRMHQDSLRPWVFPKLKKVILISETCKIEVGISLCHSGLSPAYHIKIFSEFSKERVYPLSEFSSYINSKKDSASVEGFLYPGSIPLLTSRTKSIRKYIPIKKLDIFTSVNEIVQFLNSSKSFFHIYILYSDIYGKTYPLKCIYRLDSVKLIENKLQADWSLLYAEEEFLK